MTPKRPAIVSWCRLLRIPNYFTVPGDVLAGYVLAGGDWTSVGLLGWVLLLSLCLYAFGIVLNDLADVKEDRRERPDRPLPSGEITTGQAVGVAAGLLVISAAIVIGAARPVTVPATGLVVMIVLYSIWMKHAVVLGEMLIACCRLLNVMLGALVVTPVPVSLTVEIGATVIFIYIFGISFEAREETRTFKAPLIGALVRGLILVQAVIIAVCGEYMLSLAVAALWIPSTWLGRRFYSS